MLTLPSNRITTLHAVLALSMLQAPLQPADTSIVVEHRATGYVVAEPPQGVEAAQLEANLAQLRAQVDARHAEPSGGAIPANAAPLTSPSGEATSAELARTRAEFAALSEKVEWQDKRVADLSMLGEWLGVFIALATIAAGFLAFFAAKNQAEKSARTTAEDWFARKDHELKARIQSFEERISGLEQKAEQSVQALAASTLKKQQESHQQVDSIIEAVSMQMQSKAQADIDQAVARTVVLETPTTVTPSVGLPQQSAIQAASDEARRKPEPQQTYRDWMARALSSYLSDKLPEAVAHFGSAATVHDASQAQIATAMVHQAYVLDQIGQHDRAVEVYDSMLGRFSTNSEPLLQEQVGRALVGKGASFAKQARYLEAIKLCDQVIVMFGTAVAPGLREQAAIALYNKGVALVASGDSDGGMDAYNEFISKFDDAASVVLRELLGRALVNIGVQYRIRGRFELAVEAYNGVISRFESAREPGLQLQALFARLNKGIALEANRDYDAACAVYDALIADVAKIPEFVFAKAVVGKGVSLQGKGDHDAAIAAFDQVIQRLGMSTDVKVREEIIGAMINKGAALGAKNQHAKAIELYDQALTLIGSVPEGSLREVFARAHVNKGHALAEAQEFRGAVQMYDRVIVQFRSALEHDVRERVAQALVGKGVALDALGDRDAAIGTYSVVVSEFENAPERKVREQVAVALNNRAFAYIVAAKQARRASSQSDAWRSALGRAIESVDRSLEIVANDPTALENRAYALFLLGQRDVARHVLQEALQLGGERIRDAAYADAKKEPLPEDEDFLRLVDELWKLLT